MDEINNMLAVLDEPARTIILTAAFTGLRKGKFGAYVGKISADVN
jgi:hypothetical protein